MLLNTGKAHYRIVGEVLNGEVNDVYVCQKQNEPTAPYKTVWLVKDRLLARELMGKLDGVCETCFMHNEAAGFVFAYGEDRPLCRFYLNAVQCDAASPSRIWLDLVVRCMTSGLPPAVLNVILKQRQFHIGADGDIWLGSFVDLSEYDAQTGEKENVALCAACIMELIALGAAAKTPAAAKNIRVMKLIQKKLDRNEYQEFMQLYSDIRLMTRDSGRRGSKERLKDLVVTRQDTIYRILAAICIVLVCMVIFMLVGHLLFGEFSFWKLFHAPLNRIGTESLLQ
ncbi:MAG: hypothetical protein K2P44_15985 [Lachnospiraceae bacterium]|nr:hypothetical protein [Lachnospiraceae bacterium]